MASQIRTLMPPHHLSAVRVIALMLSVLLMLSACASEPDSNNPASDAANASGETTEPEPTEPDEPVVDRA